VITIEAEGPIADPHGVELAANLAHQGFIGLGLRVSRCKLFPFVFHHDEIIASRRRIRKGKP
jgi:hypothetical protein